MINRLILLMAALLAPAVVLAANPIDGTWKVDTARSKLPSKPFEYLLQGGVYRCLSCVPPLTVAADGKDNPVKGDPDMDMANVRVVDEHRVGKAFMKDGKKLASSSFSVSSDGKTAIGEYTSYVGVGTAGPVTWKFEYTRLKAGPAGAHAHSGSWRQSKLLSGSDATLTMTVKLQGNTLTMSSPTGQSYSASLDGTEAPYIGDPYTDTVSVKRIDARTFEEADKRAGKVTIVSRMTVAADGKTLVVKTKDLVNGRDSEDLLRKQ